MRILLSIIIILYCTSCSQDKASNSKVSPQMNDSVFGIKLISADFLLYSDSSQTDSLTNQLKKSFYIYNDRNNKILHVDAEELAECQFDFFLPRLNVILNKRHFQLTVETVDNETSNEIFLNGEKIQLYTKDEMEKSDFWDIASRSFFKKLNELLKKQNSSESFFLLYQGNDLHAILLTDKQFYIISGRYKNEPKEIPYRP